MKLKPCMKPRYDYGIPVNNELQVASNIDKDLHIRFTKVAENADKHGDHAPAETKRRIRHILL